MKSKTGLFNPFPKLPLADNRVLSGYLFVYHVYLTGVVPPYVLIRALWQQHRGQPAMFARAECWLYLAFWTVYVFGCVVYPDDTVIAPLNLLKRKMN